MAKIGFEFPVDSSGQWDGFNDPGIEHFAGNRLQHLGREVPQNTIDAKVDSPARITVSLRKVPVKSLPGLAHLKDAVARCAQAAIGEGSDKAVSFFFAASKLLEGRDLYVLQLRDSNTTGLEGPCVNGKPFFAMMKATGQSKKVGTSTGSYGIGKFAPFTVSELRTVFVSTVWADETETLHHYVQGKSVLMSHQDPADKIRQGTGFWGVREMCQPVEGLVKEVPDWLRLTDEHGAIEGQQGTMLSIIGFSPAKGWQNVLAANIVENFFGAIIRGDLEVNIDRGASINAKTLPTILSDAAVRASISDQPGEPERFENISNYLRALENDTEVHVETSENYYLGTCELRILVGENLPRRVAMLRNGMLITETLPGLIRFGDFKEFVAVLECPTEKGNELLRAMEPPRHDAFEPDRLPPDRRQNGRTALRELATWVRRMLARHAKDPVAEETSLDELAAFFGDEDDEGALRQKDENPGGTITIRARAIKPKIGAGAFGGSSTSVDDEESSESDAEGVGEGDVGGPGGTGGDTTTGTNIQTSSGLGVAQQQRTQSTGLPLGNVRAVPLSQSSRRVAFTPAETGTLTIELQDSGADTNYALKAISTSIGTIEHGRIAGITAKAGQRCVIDVTLAQAFLGTLRIVANAV
jgi:hypothetical protein